MKMGEDDMNDKDRRKLALSEMTILVLAGLAITLVIWLAWFR